MGCNADRGFTFQIFSCFPMPYWVFNRMDALKTCRDTYFNTTVKAENAFLFLQTFSCGCVFHSCSCNFNMIWKTNYHTTYSASVKHPEKHFESPDLWECSSTPYYNICVSKLVLVSWTEGKMALGSVKVENSWFSWTAMSTLFPFSLD